MTMNLERYMNSNVLDVPRTPTNTWYGHALNPKWKSAVQRVVNGEGIAKILCVGDSTTYGTAAEMPNGYMNERSWPTRMAQQLQRHVAATIYGLVVPPSESSSVPARLLDSRWTLGAGWGRPSTAGVGFGGLNSTLRGAPGSELLFNDPRVTANRWDVYYTTNTSGTLGEMTVQATGGSAVTVQQGSQPEISIKKVTVSAPSSGTDNILSIRNTGASGNIYVLGVEPYLNGASRIRVANAGSSGSTTTSWLQQNSTAGNGWNYFEYVKAYEPDLVIFDLGINDATHITAAQYITNMQRLIDGAEAAGAAVLLKTMIPSSGAKGLEEEAYVSALNGDLDRNYPIVDIFNHYRSYERNDYRGWMKDTVHGGDDIYQDVGEIVAEFLFRYSGH